MSSPLIGRRFVDIDEGAQIARQIQFMLCFRGKYAVFDDEFDPAPLNVQKIVKVKNWLFVFEFWSPGVKYAFVSDLDLKIYNIKLCVFWLSLLFVCKANQKVST